MKFSLLTSVSSVAMGAGLLVAFAGSAEAGSTIQTLYTDLGGIGGPGASLSQVVLTPTPHGSSIGSVTIQDFVPGANQHLTSVVVTETGYVAATGSITNGGTASALYTLNFNSKITAATGIGTPTNFPLYSKGLNPNTTANLTSGDSKPLAVSSNYPKTYTSITSGLSQYTSPTAKAFTVNFTAYGTQGETGNNPLNFTLLGTALAEVQVTYNYSTIVTTPEPASLAIIGMGLAGMGVIRRRRKA